MTYSSGGIIQATDFNTFVGSASSTTTTELNAIWGAGTGDMGYGQTIGDTAPVVGGSDPSVSDEVTAPQWSTLLNRINAMRQHQGAAAPYTAGDIPTTGDLVEVVSNIQTNINACYTNRHSYGAAGTTTNGSNFTWTINLAAGTFTGSQNRVLTWPSAAEMRYFFNAGGQVTFRIVSADNTDNDTRGNTVESWLESNLNNITVRAKTTSYGGATSYPTWGTSRGRYDLSTGASTLFNYEPGGTYGTTNSVRLNALVNNASIDSATSMTFNLYVAVLQGYNNSTTYTDTINVIHRIDIIEPSTTYLSKTWSVPTIT